MAILDTFKSVFGGNTASRAVGNQVASSHPSCNNDGVTDSGLLRTATIRGALNAAILGMNTLTALKIAEMQHDLAKDYADLAKSYRDHYFNKYHPIERELIEEAKTEPEYVRDKDEFYKGQMLISAKMPFVGKLEKAVSCTGRYCTGQRQAVINDVLIEQAMTESLVCGFAHRFADDEQVVRDNKRWERRANVIKLGSNIPTEAVSYASMATGVFGSIGEQASRAAQGAAWYLGQGERRETRYPERRGPLTIVNYVPKVPHVQDVTPYEVPKVSTPTIPRGTPIPAEITLKG